MLLISSSPSLERKSPEGLKCICLICCGILVPGTAPQVVGAQKMLAKRVNPSVAAKEAKRREDKGKLWWDTAAPVVGTGVNMEVQAQISLILVSVAPGGNVDLRRFMVGWVPRDAASQLQTQ